MTPYVLLNSDKVYMLKTNQCVLLYVDMHPVYSIGVCITRGGVCGSFDTQWFIELYSRLQIDCEGKFGTGCEKQQCTLLRSYHKVLVYMYLLGFTPVFVSFVDWNLGALYCHEQWTATDVASLDFLRGWYRPHIAHGYLLMICLRA